MNASEGGKRTTAYLLLETHTLFLSLSLSQFSMALSLPISSLESDIKTKNSGCPESEIGSQGLRKQILKKGNSWQTPFPGDEVEGTPFHFPVCSSHKANQNKRKPKSLIFSHCMHD